MTCNTSTLDLNVRLLQKSVFVACGGAHGRHDNCAAASRPMVGLAVKGLLLEGNDAEQAQPPLLATIIRLKAALRRAHCGGLSRLV